MIEVRTTQCYDKWLKGLDTSTMLRVQRCIDRLRYNNFGDHKSVGDSVWELRFRFGGGIRIYYTYDGKEIVLLLAGGNKKMQKNDIALAKYIANNRGKQ